ncbi:MAG: ribonuclease Z [Candidatus Woesearchaeota archaeon]
MTEIQFLGTSCMQPTKDRNHSGVLLSFKGENILFDCGEGIQRQMRLAGIKPAKITKLCISHWHGDHVFGIPGLLSAMGADQFSKKLQIYGPKGTKKYFEHMFQSFTAKGIVAHEIYEVSPGTFFENDEFKLETQNLKHSTPCIGFSFIEKSRLRINVVKAKSLGLEGPLLGRLQDGEDIVYKGKKVKSADLTYAVPSKKITIFGDTMPCEGADILAKDADLLISEGTHLDDIKEKTEKSMHLTVKQAALIASENNVKKLIITHISPRYKTTTDIVSEARDHFDNSIVAKDFMKIKV